MKRILITYATFAGSSQDVAQVVAEELAKQSILVDVLPLNEVSDLAAYDAVVLGAPMIMGWHREALNFLKQRRKSFQQIPLAIFVMAMSLTETGERNVDGVPVCVDAGLPKAPKIAGQLSFRERYARLSNYIRPILSAIHPAKPASIAIFAGRLEYGRLKWWAVLFAQFIIHAPAGDKRNWEAIRAWAAGLPTAFQFKAPETEAPELEWLVE